MTTMESSPLAEAIAMVVAAALYGVAYLAFLRLLRYPRNWIRPPWGAMLGTAVLVVPALFFPAWSRLGLDFAVLAVTTGFVVGLFVIVAAPALTFKPSSSPIEFLSRYGDFAGLWMAIPAFAAVFAFPNPKLQALLVTAVVIEGVWFLRQRWANRERRLYPIDERDLSVMKKQAEGDLEGFARRHGIHELVLSGGAVAWRGCGKTILPCPFNFYVNRLGFNTAPCCRESLEDVGHRVAGWLRELEITYWLEGGTLLGAVRENGNLLAWEDDVDISYLLESDETWRKLAEGIRQRARRDGYSVEIFPKMETIAISYDLPKPWPFRWERNRMRGEIRVDLVGYRPGFSHGEPVIERIAHKGGMPHTESGRYGVARELVLPTTEIALFGSQFSCPAKPEEFLRVLYGDFREVEYTYLEPAAALNRRLMDAAVS